MITIKQAVIVEGKYDKIRLSNLLDTIILTTDGFRIFKDKEKMELIRLLAKKQGVVILTDSDSAGFLIRNHLSDRVKEGEIIHVCLPELLGKEKRKAAPSRENLLGVEGTDDAIILQALERAGIIGSKQTREPVTKAMLYADGFHGGPDSRQRREALLDYLGIPKSISPNMLPAMITQIAGKEEYERAVLCLSTKFEQNT